MKRAAEPALTPYAQLCSRLGVNPKQFMVLLAVAGGAIALLGGKALLTRPATATAETPTSEVAPAPAAAAPAPAPTGAAPGATTAESAPPGPSNESPTVVVRLDTAPRRDPFRPFIERPKAPLRDSSVAPPDDSLKAPDLAMFELRATMDGEWVVINGQTLRIGDIVGLASDGTPIKLSAVGHRVATLEWRGKNFEIAFTH